jgi:hypothetical protein
MIVSGLRAMRTRRLLPALLAAALLPGFAACRPAEPEPSGPAPAPVPGDPPAAPAPGVERPIQGLLYGAETFATERPTALRAVLTVRNPSDRDAIVEFPDGCMVLLRVYRNEARTGTPAWDQRRERMCTQAIVQLRLAPGGAERYETRATAAEILGDSLPPGRYWLAALVRPGGEHIDVPAGSVILER